MFKFMNWSNKMLMDKAGGEGGGGSGTLPAPSPTPAPAPTGDLDSLKAQNADLLKRLEALEGKGKLTPEPEDLATKARLKREAEDKIKGDSKTLESALRFAIQSKDWLKSNESLLPKTIAGIFESADKEVYGSAVEKANAIKIGIVSEFFAQQVNLDLLTENQKIAVEDFKKLTKTDKESRVQQIYDSIFEPTFEMLKKIKKAEAVRSGLGDPSDAETAYKNKLKAMSKKHYLGEKNA